MYVIWYVLYKAWWSKSSHYSLKKRPMIRGMYSISLIKCPHKYSDGLRSCNCGVKSSVVFFGVKMVLAKCWLYFGTLSCCSITSWILPKQCVTKYLIHSSTLDSLYLHENLASPLFKCSLEITTHILRAFCWFLTFYFANHASVKKALCIDFVMI